MGLGIPSVRGARRSTAFSVPSRSAVLCRRAKTQLLCGVCAALSVPALDDVQRSFLGSMFGFMGSFLPFLHEFGSAEAAVAIGLFISLKHGVGHVPR